MNGTSKWYVLTYADRALEIQFSSPKYVLFEDAFLEIEKVVRIHTGFRVFSLV